MRRHGCGSACATRCAPTGRGHRCSRSPRRARSRWAASRIVPTANPGEPGQAFPRSSCACPDVSSVRNPVAWAAAVDTASSRLRAGEAAKVVLAREVVAHGDGVVSAGSVTRSLRSAYPSCFTYLITGADGTAFAGASPELLVRRAGAHAHAQPMAGSVARGASEAEDDMLANRLMASAKDAAEHALASRFVVGALQPYSSTVSARPPEVVRFTNIQHLATSVDAELTNPPAEVLELAAALHPTPAVGGWPREAADRIIDDLEAMERGWYAGAVGWTDSRGDGEFAVALRCGLLWGDGARLYAGVGVMPDSDPARELEETDLKFKALLSALT
ncbi:MAG: isochorismate synthase [Chloroflexi bacterium]|nr:MAG: isochorismate synthase [Chloroflexota bacterium]